MLIGVNPVLREMFGNRGIYHEGWMASTRHSIPWDMAAKILALKDDLWERYDVRNDFSQADNLAGKYPDKRQVAEGFRQGGDPQQCVPDRRPARRALKSDHRKKLAEGKIPKTQPFAFSADEGADVGLDGETNVSNDYKQGDNAFTGKINRVTVEVK